MMGSKSDQFVNDLVQFYRNRGHHNPQPQQFIARINGKIVDLSQLYAYVIENGGSFRVNQFNLWDDIYCKLFKASNSGANISVALRQIYARYLLPYERTFSSNFGSDLLDDEEDESNFSFSSNHSHSHNHHNHSYNSQIPTFSIPSNSYQYQFSQSVSTNNVSETANPLNKLFCSLLSGLPNELDFALKVSTILINSNRFDWSSDIKYLNLLLECSKNYCCVCDEHQSEDSIPLEVESDDEISQFLDSDLQNTCNCYQKFWYQCCADEQTLELAFGAPDPNIEELSQQDYNKIKQRIQLIADIIRNLSFTYDSECLPSGSLSSALLMKFLLLLLNSSEQQLNNTALDIISNIASITALVSEDKDYIQIQQSLHRRCVHLAMTSHNVVWTSRGLEIISRLFASNVEEITCFIESDLREYEVFIRITHLMTCQYDITLLLAILEFCLSLSEQRPYMLLKDENKHLIKILLTLLNSETSQHFTTTALKRMKIIDERMRTQKSETSETSGQQTVLQQQSVSSVQNSIPTSGQTNSVDNETFAMNWLRLTYEPIATECQSLKASDLYADYVKHCCKNSRRNVMAAQPFSQLIKRCFPSSSLTNNQTTIEGIVAKSTQTPQTPTKSNPTPTLQVMSPILKAHLSAPPKNSNTSTPTVNTSTNCNNTNLINSNANTSTTSISSSSSLPTPTTNTSTLIKSLLANKLRSNAIIATNATNAVTPSPTKSSINTSVCTNTTPIATTPTSKATTPAANVNSNTIFESNGELVVSTGSQSSQTLSAMSITPSISSISLTPTNTIIPVSASNSTISGHSVHPQQQFLLVRTIITSPGQQQSGSGLTTTGTPVRLILPASMLTQQRLNSPGLNGMTTSSSPLTTVTLSAANSLTANNTTFQATNTSDLFLKTVVSNSNGANSVPVTPIRSNVKSSPLLNVLLDKGKLPEFSTSTVINNQISGNSFGAMTNSATLMSSQTPKMYILTTKSPLAIKSLPALQNQLNAGQQCLPQQQLSPMCAPLQTLHTHHTTNATFKSSTYLTNTTIANIITTLSSTATTSALKQSVPNSCITPAINGEMSSSVHSVNSVLNNSVNTIHSITNSSVNSVNNTVNSVNSLSADTTGTVIKSNCVNTINSIPSSDLSSIKDIKKAVDDATRLIAKRRNEDTADPLCVGANKKLKLNSVLTIPSSAVSTHNSIPNHDLSSDPNNSDSNPINISVINTNTTNTTQVLTKASTLLTTTPSPAVTTITTITSNNIKSNCNTNITNNSNNSNNNNPNKDNKNISNTNKNSNNSNNNNNSTNGDFECQWNDCKKTFVRAAEVFLHVHNHHIMAPTFPSVMTCLWGGQEGTGPGCLSKRPKLSLLTHLLDFHCNPNVLQQDSVRKKQLSSVGSTAIVLPQPPAHPGYAHNAALLAIKRHATNYVEAPTLPPVTKLTPLTVSIRLTAALILRNLAQHSIFVRRTLEGYEQYLCELCMTDGRDESRTIAQCLAVITDKT